MKLSIEEKNGLDSYYEAMEEIQTQEANHNKIILDDIKNNVEENEYLEIIKYIEDSDNGIDGSFKITENPKGNIQDLCDYDYFKVEWIEQFCGLMGDDYSGTCTIHMSDDRFLEMPFNL